MNMFITPRLLHKRIVNIIWDLAIARFSTSFILFVAHRYDQPKTRQERYSMFFFVQLTRPIWILKFRMNGTIVLTVSVRLIRPGSRQRVSKDDAHQIEKPPVETCLFSKVEERLHLPRKGLITDHTGLINDYSLLTFERMIFCASSVFSKLLMWRKLK